MPAWLKFLVFALNLLQISRCYLDLNKNVIQKEHFVFWPNATIPFYINPDHFDKEQSMAIMSALALLTFKTCLRFNPVFAEPKPDAHVMVFENPRAVRKCVIDREGHAKDQAHRITVGFECTKSPQIDMVLMKALGFPFEHNRASRDLYIDVQFENIEPGSVELFNKERILPVELRALPYDVNSVMHFGERDFSKNGHRSLIFKNPKTQQNRVGLSPIDLQKIEIIYGPECKNRDRLAKIDICKNFPIKTRRKRDVDAETVRNLRINRDITPPPARNLTEDAEKTLKNLNIQGEVEDLIDKVHKITSMALKNAKLKHCNVTKNDLRSNDDIHATNDIISIVEMVAEYTESIVSSAVDNLTIFCDDSVKELQRSCGGNPWCPRSTKVGPVRHSTQHRPVYAQPTRHDGSGKQHQYDYFLRSDNSSTVKNDTNRSKREVESLDDDKKAGKGENVPVEVGESTPIPDIGKSANESKSILRSATTVISYRTRPNFAPGRRSYDDRHYSKYSFKDRNPYQEKSYENYKNKYKQVNEYERPDDREDDYQKAKKMRREKNKIKEKMSEETERHIYKDSEQQYSKYSYVQENLDGLSSENYNKKKKKLKKNHRNPENVESDYERTTEKFRKERKRIKDRISEETERDRDKEKDQSYSEYSHKQRKPDIDESSSENYEKKKQRQPEYKDDEGYQKPTAGKRKDRKRIKERLSVETERNRNIDDGYKQKKLQNHGKQETKLPEKVELNKETKEFYEERMWPDGELPYMLEKNSKYDLEDVRARLAEVKSILKQKTCVRMTEITEEDTRKYTDYVVLDTSYDFVTGKVGGRQNFGVMELFEGGQHRQHAAMMVMAMLGFYFEVARHDRDKYIRVHVRHIRPDKLHHFETIRADATMPLPYDYKSATHPAWQFWRRIGKTGISTVATYKDKDPDGSVMKSLGQNEELLSKIDIIKINTIYGTSCFDNHSAE